MQSAHGRHKPDRLTGKTHLLQQLPQARYIIYYGHLGLIADRHPLINHWIIPVRLLDKYETAVSHVGNVGRAVTGRLKIIEDIGARREIMIYLDQRYLAEFTGEDNNILARPLGIERTPLDGKAQGRPGTSVIEIKIVQGLVII